MERIERATTLDTEHGTHPLTGKRIFFAGKLEDVTKRDAHQLTRLAGAIPVQRWDHTVDIVVTRSHFLPLGDDEGPLIEQIMQAASQGQVEIVSETIFWQRLGLMDSETEVRRLYTPAMLAELLGVPVGTIRRWQRRGLIVPARVEHRLAYFDFQEVATARHLAKLVAAGESPQGIEKKLAALARFMPGIERPLVQLSVIVEGRQIFLRQGEGLVEPGGQLRIDFERFETEEQEGSAEPAMSTTVSLADYVQETRHEENPESLLESAAAFEDEGQFEQAVDLYRAALAAGGPQPVTCFHLAELLYRLGDVTAARERYFMALELDEDFIEARANLGCVLAELGKLDAAVAAFQGTLAQVPDFPDVHYHLARALDELARADEAQHHWNEFLRLAPASPWAEEARQRLERVSHP